MGKRRQFPLMNKDSIDFKSHLAAVSEEVEVILNGCITSAVWKPKSSYRGNKVCSTRWWKKTKALLNDRNRSYVRPPK